MGGFPFTPLLRLKRAEEKDASKALFSGVSRVKGVSRSDGGFEGAEADLARVFYADLWGTREHKLETLEKGDIEFAELSLDPKLAFFVPFDGEGKELYESGVSIAELFPVSVTGIVSGNDNAAIAPTRDELAQRIEIAKNATDEAPIRELWGKFGDGQAADKIQNDVLSPDGAMTPISYRPFDTHWTYYSGNSCGWVFRPREKKTMGNLLQPPSSPIGQNIGLVYPKGTNKFWDGAFISASIIDAHFIDYPGRSIAYIAPLYLHSEIDGSWSPNINADALARLTENLGFQPEPIEIFDYVYGVLYDPVYRERYNEYLKRDFPRVPCPLLKAMSTT